ncbi:GntR family transcriptional regulator [Litorimonas haliclonae]|uniref:GntR family transcriptional regulator n=1 Tax=Litorimonas haliclonae TaxID=2081977 RepID=UPI0039EF7B49
MSCLENDLTIGPLNPDKPEPLYHQLYTALKNKIQTGALPTGAKVPSEKELSDNLDVSRITVKRALNDLAESGLVSRSRGRGTIVTASTDLKFSDPMHNYVKNVTRLRKSTTAQILSRDVLSASPETARNLKRAEGIEVEKICHTLSLEKKVLSYVETFVPDGLAKNFHDDELCHEPLMTLLSKSGVLIERAEQTLFPVSSDSHIAEILGTEVNRPLLKIHCIMIEESGRSVEDIHAWYHPDHYKYQMTLTALNLPKN